ncbi:MAG: MBOAT family protein [Muribaculaceae bacterium]|nr:MBOAT family protein [Muribaculaceae bacterium]
MVFSDLLFIFVFLPLFIISYIIGGWIDNCRKNKATDSGLKLHRPMLWRNLFLVIFSLIFYSWGEPVYILLMIFSVIINYISGLIIAKESGKWKKAALVIGVACDLAILGSFKYLGFFCGSLASIGFPIPVPQIALPIGISFYIFQSISYLVDVYRGNSPVQKNFFDLLLYIAMFPQLIAGPIVRYDTVAREINQRSASAQDIAEGVYRFTIGLFKKVVFANILGEIATQLLAGDITNLSMAGAWVGIIAFSLQIYFDFSGYSDMAIGMGRSLGFHFNENFDHPYTATSITNFWRKWHMSLGSFFRDYVYIPMGGNRRHQVLNIMTVWFLTGMWHGASWNFIFWGLYFGLIIFVEKYTLLKWNIPRVLSHIYALFVVIVSFGLFYFDDLGRMGEFYRAFFGMNAPQGLPLDVETVLSDNFWLWVAAIVFCLPIRPFVAKKLDKFAANANGNTAVYTLYIGRALIALTILVVCASLLVGATNNAFIYTRF